MSAALELSVGVNMPTEEGLNRLYRGLKPHFYDQISSTENTTTPDSEILQMNIQSREIIHGITTRIEIFHTKTLPYGDPNK